MVALWLQTVLSRVSTVPNWGQRKTMLNTQWPFRHSSQLYQTCLSSSRPLSLVANSGTMATPPAHLWSPYLHMTKPILPGLPTPRTKPEPRERFSHRYCYSGVLCIRAALLLLEAGRGAGGAGSLLSCMGDKAEPECDGMCPTPARACTVEGTAECKAETDDGTGTLIPCLIVWH